MKFSSEKGYSLVEIGVAILIITIFAALNLALYSNTYTNYRIVEQRNTALTYAIVNMEDLLQKDMVEFNITPLDPDDIHDLIYDSEISPEDLLTDEFSTVFLEVIGPSAETNNMRITRKLSRIPIYENSHNFYGYDESLLKAHVAVEYKLKTSDVDWQVLTIESLRVNKSEGANEE